MMRSARSHALLAAPAFVLIVLGLNACVPSADDDGDDTVETLTSLSVETLPTATVVTTTTTVPGAGEVVVTAGTVTTTSSAATQVPDTSADTTDTAEAPESTPTTSGATTTTSATGPGTYTVVAKDTLFGIALRCKIGPAELANYNDWTDGIAHVIIPGQKIKMPCVPADSSATTTTAADGSGATTTTAASGATTTVVSGPGGTYTVQAGDFLSGIAAKTGTTVDAIVEVNGWEDGANHVIFPGQVIKMPVKEG